MAWVVDFTKEVMKTPTTANEPSIYKISACAKDLHKTAYMPQAVSFGPFHSEEEELKLQMDAHKKRALRHFIVSSHKTLGTYVNQLHQVVQQLMDSYDSLDDKWRREEHSFLKLMLLDGCFMIEILRANDVIDKCGQTYEDYGVKDPVFSHHGKLYVMPYMRRDMLMLQNQLPMLLLQILLTTEAKDPTVKDGAKYLRRLILKFVNPRYEIPADRQVDSLHVLDLYRESLLGYGQRLPPPMMTCPTTQNDKDAEDIIRSAEKLHEAGIEFEAKKTANLMDISFHRGTLKIPPIVVDDTTESAFLNLMAFERLHVGAGNEITSFVYFMDNVIDSARDVSLLHSGGIIHNAVGSEKAVANLFNGIAKDVTPDPEGSLEKVHHALDIYCNRKWHQWRANLKHNYFRSPWALLSLFAAIFLVILTITQTIYAIITYHYPKDNCPPPPPPPPSRFSSPPPPRFF